MRFALIQVRQGSNFVLSSDEQEDISEMAQALLRYLKKHPSSADTKEGIVRWWVLEQHLQEQIIIVENELNKLVQRGLVEKSDLTGRAIYRAAR